MSQRETTRIVIVGDERRELEPILAHGGFDLRHTEPSSVEAAALEFSPDVVILGPTIPFDRALALLESIGNSGAGCAVAIVGTLDSRERERAYESGAADCIAEPSGPLELLVRVGRLARDVAQRRDLGRCAGEIASSREQARRLTNELQAASQEVRRVSATDSLTGAANPRRFYEVLEQEWKRAQRADGPISLLLIDLDFFRLFNETRGHAVGDDCLRDVARILQGCLNRAGDFLARYGGEEFLVLIPGGDEAQAQALANLLLQRVRELGLRHESSPKGIVTVSIGVATVTPTNEMSPANLLGAVEDGLRAAKTSGRDRAAVGRAR
jgi:diguanylate cyclase (GGDEF)-like protein